MGAVAAVIAPARWPEDRADVRALMRAYVDGLGVDIGFQDVETELATLPGRYAPPSGGLFLARCAGVAAGVVAWRTIAPATAEMKRLYVPPAFRGRGLARALAEALMADARAAGCRRMLLDTLDTMAAARGLYAALGFTPVAAYYDNPLPGAAYLGRDL